MSNDQDTESTNRLPSEDNPDPTAPVEGRGRLPEKNPANTVAPDVPATEQDSDRPTPQAKAKKNKSDK